MEQVLGRLADRNWRQGLAQPAVCALETDLQGLKIRYELELPSGQSQKREWRCNKVMDVASKLKFDLEGNVQWNLRKVILQNCRTYLP